MRYKNCAGMVGKTPAPNGNRKHADNLIFFVWGWLILKDVPAS